MGIHSGLLVTYTKQIGGKYEHTAVTTNWTECGTKKWSCSLILPVTAAINRNEEDNAVVHWAFEIRIGGESNKKLTNLNNGEEKDPHQNAN